MNEASLYSFMKENGWITLPRQPLLNSEKGCNISVDGMLLMIFCCSEFVFRVVFYFLVHVQIPCIDSIHVSEFARNWCLTLSCP